MPNWGRRAAACLAFLCVVSLAVPTLMAPHGNGSQAQAITTLRAINAAQLLFSTTHGNGKYALRLEDLEQQGLLTQMNLESLFRRGYRVELIPGDEGYAAVAVPVPNPRLKASDPVRAFCVDERGSIFQTLGGQIPAVAKGRCRDRSKPLQ